MCVCVLCVTKDEAILIKSQQHGCLKQDFNKNDTNRYANMKGGNITGLQPYIKQARNLESERNIHILPQRKAPPIDYAILRGQF